MPPPADAETLALARKLLALNDTAAEVRMGDAEADQLRALLPTLVDGVNKQEARAAAAARRRGGGSQ